MYKRPSLQEAFSTLHKYRHLSSDVDDILVEYEELKSAGKEFLGARLLVESVDSFYLEQKRVANGEI